MVPLTLSAVEHKNQCLLCHILRTRKKRIQGKGVTMLHKSSLEHSQSRSFIIEIACFLSHFLTSTLLIIEKVSAIESWKGKTDVQRCQLMSPN